MGRCVVSYFTYSEEELGDLAISRYLDYRKDSVFTIGVIKFIDEANKIERLSYSIRQFVIHNILEELFVQKNITMEGLMQTEKGFWIFIISGNPVISEEELHPVLDKLLQQSLELLQCAAAIGYCCNLTMEEVRSRYMDLEEACIQNRLNINDACEISTVSPAVSLEKVFLCNRFCMGIFCYAYSI